MKRNFLIKLAPSLAIATALAFPSINAFGSIDAALAQSAPASGTFSATRTCAAQRAINGANPGNIRVSNGQRYQAFGFNSAQKNFILIKVPGATPERRWVNASCGTFSKTSPSPIASPGETSQATLLPFFDNVNNPEQHGFPRNKQEDITPPPPQLNAFDQAVLKTCGTIGAKVNARDFKQLMSNNPDVLREIKQSVGGKLRPVRTTEAEFLDDLTAVWSERGGFEHIFCGELDGSQKIGGLHFAGRYLQLQQQGIAGRLPQNLGKEEVIPGQIYTLGVVIKNGNQTVRDDRKGYALGLDAKEILLNATKAFNAQGNAQGACLLPIQDGQASFKAVFVKDRSAIVTFYPDATPSGKACKN